MPNIIPAAHLPASGQTLRKNNYGHPFRLTEHCPSQNPIEVINWLDVEHSLRYKPTGSTTFCNIYGYDYACFTGYYLPRVWWFPKSILAFQSGKTVEPVLNKTVGELSANALYRWFDEWSDDFGWAKLSSVEEAQNAANNNQTTIICGRRKVESTSGHISVVAPESDELRALRKDGKFILPCQSQAGGKNIRLGHNYAWWEGQEFAEHGFWTCPK